MGKNVILASGSAIRSQLLSASGVDFEVVVPRVDEAAVMASLLAEDAKPLDIADALAEYKGLRISMKRTESIVIAVDQVLVCNGEVFSKARDLSGAKTHLKTLRGQGHQLLSAVVIFEDGQPVWRFAGRAQLVMRDFSDAFLADYIEEHGEDVLSSVGCYKLENEGVQLFSKVQGDYFTILGLPLLEVLGFLRTRGVLAQ